MSIAHVLLGVLAVGPAHGYDLKREHDARFPGSKDLPYGQVYASLQRLERKGFVEIVETVQKAGPERSVYAVTKAGRAELDEWLSVCEPAGPYAADDLVRKTVTALRLGADAREFLERQRAVHLARMRALLAVQDATADVTGRIAVDHSVFHLDADLRWLEAAAARVGNRETKTKESGE